MIPDGGRRKPRDAARVDGEGAVVANDRPDVGGGEGLDGSWVPPEVDLSHPSIARLYDYLLGGKEHFEIDRRATEAMFKVVPDTPHIAKDNRNHMRRGVHHLVADAGIRQIIDLGSGLPTVGNVHEIAHTIDPEVRVVYVDIDPIVLAHGRALLADETSTTVITADIRDVDAVFDHPVVGRYVDLDQPFAVIAAGIVHHLADADAYATTAAIRERLTPGSYLMISHFLDDDEPRARQLERAFLDGGLGTGRFRTWAELQPFFEGLEMVEPGLVYANEWRPDERTPAESPVHTLYAAGIGRRSG